MVLNMCVASWLVNIVKGIVQYEYWKAEEGKD